MVGRTLDGRFRIEALLGEGGLGQVFRGVHLRLNRPVAIKVMHEHHVTKDELRTRFDREAKSLAALAHPNVVGVIDYGVDGELPFLVMELLEGRTLEAAIQEGLPQDRIVPIFRDVLRAVAYAHGIGLVHRDLKPANVFLQRVPEIGEVVRVLDFGLAKFIDGEGAHATVTRAGMVIGTPAYMSPEQATASVVDARADVYSLGVVLFEMITGQRPFNAADGAEVLRKHLLQPLPKMAALVPSSALAPMLEPIVLRATEKSKADRYLDAAEMAAALDAIVGRASTPVIAAPVAARGKTSAARPDSIHVTISDVPVSVQSGPAAEAPRDTPAPSRAGLIVALGVAGAIGLALFFGLRAPATDASPAQTPPPPSSTSVAAPPSSVVVAPPTSVVLPPTSVAPPPTVTPNPWAEPTPPQLAPIEARVRDEREINAEQRALLFRFSANHPHDPRGLLLLGHAEVIAHAYSDACHRYQHAYNVDHDARFDPAMRHDLVSLAARDSTADEASVMVREIYGAEALPEIEAVQFEHPHDPDALDRLARLRATLTP